MTNNGKCAALFAGGVIFGSVGIKLLTPIWPPPDSA